MSFAEFYQGRRELTKSDGITIVSQTEIDDYLHDWELRNLQAVRHDRVRETLKGIDVTSDLLIEENDLAKEGELKFLDQEESQYKRNTRTIFREADLNLFFGKREDMYSPNYRGILKRYSITVNNSELLVDIFAPENYDPKQWTINSIGQFLDGTFSNMEMA